MVPIARHLTWVLLGTTLTGCSLLFAPDDPSSPSRPTSDDVSVSEAPSEGGQPLMLIPSVTHDLDGRPWVEAWTGGASRGEDVPVIVALHGRGDTPERFAMLLQELPIKARVVVPAGSVKMNDVEFDWLDIPPSKPDDALTYALDQHADNLDAFLTDIGLASGPVTLLGWAQGGMVAATWAFAHPERAAHVVMAGGQLPKSVRDRGASLGERLRLIHMVDDPIIPITGSQVITNAIPGSHLTPVEGTGHMFDRDMVAATFPALGLPLIPGYSLPELEVEHPDGLSLQEGGTPRPGPDGEGTPEEAQPSDDHANDEQPFRAFTPAQ